MIAIYALTEADGEIRYIGKAEKPLRRLCDHLTEARSKAKNTHKLAWLRKLLHIGARPGLLTVEECDESVWQERERHWVVEYRRRGARLINGTDGGEGGRVDAAARRKMSLAKKGKRRTPEQVEAMRRGLMRTQADPARREKALAGLALGRVSRPHTQATRAKMREVHRQKNLRHQAIAEEIRGR